MRETRQTPSQTILQHGESVWDYTRRLIIGDFEGFKLPDWFIENHHFIVNQLPNADLIKRYNVFHDCGKPYCREICADGVTRFPNHAEVSYETYKEVFPDDEEVANLIRLDMMLHTESYQEIVARELPLPTLMTLLVTAFAELHSNAAMFGGIDSVSFKIKYKKLDKLGKKLTQGLPGHEDSYSYLITRNDLPPAQQAVQIAHATFELARQGDIQHPSFVALVVKNEAKLKKAIGELVDAGIKFKIFREPLYDNTITAVATEPLTEEKREVLKRYQLLT